MGFVFGLLSTNKIITEYEGAMIKTYLIRHSYILWCPETCPPPPSPPVRVRVWVRIRVSFRVWGNLPREQ